MEFWLIFIASDVLDGLDDETLDKFNTLADDCLEFKSSICLVKLPI